MRKSSVENGLNYEFKIKMQTKGLNFNMPWTIK